MAKAAKKKEVTLNESKAKKATARKKTVKVLENKKEVKKELKVVDQKPVEKLEKAEEKVTATAEPSKKSEPKVTKTTKAKTTKSAKKTSKKEVKAEAIVEAKPEEKEEEKKEVKKEVKKETKAATKKTVKKEVKKSPAKKKTVKKAEPKKDLEAEKLVQYNTFSIETCIDMAKAMGIQKGYDDYANYLMEEVDEAKIVQKVIEEAHVDPTAFTYEKDGYDLDLIAVLVKRIAETVTFKASDFANMKSIVESAETLELSEDEIVNNETYEKLMDVVRKVLMVAQRKNIYEVEAMNDFVGSDIEPLVVKFMDVAYEVLKDWQYKDVKYYEGFIYSVLSQFEALHQSLGNRAMMDVADLYIIHGDYNLGDANYYYIIRENSIKDLIYYRFAHVYEAIDRDKARAIAGESRQYVDDRFDYYEAIKNILEN